MDTFADINGTPDPDASDDEIRHLLWKLDTDDPLGKEPPSDTDETGDVIIPARHRRLALDNAIDHELRVKDYDQQFPYRKLFTDYSVEQLRFYARGPV